MLLQNGAERRIVGYHMIPSDAGSRKRVKDFTRISPSKRQTILPQELHLWWAGDAGSGETPASCSASRAVTPQRHNAMKELRYREGRPCHITSDG
jgi:hypothetical protein